MEAAMISRSLAFRFLVGVLILCLVEGAMASAADKKKSSKQSKDSGKPTYIFFPPAPSDPRVQFLTSYSIDADLKGGPGKFERFLVGKEPSKKTILKPNGIAMRDGRIFVCDTSGRCLVILDLNKKKMDIVIPERDGLLRSPISLALDAEGNQYVADSARGQVVIYDQQGKYLGAIGQRDEMRPVGLLIDQTHIFVSDFKNNCLRVYDKTSRKPAFEIPNERSGTNRLPAPTSLGVDTRGQIYVSQATLGQVQVFEKSGKFVRTVARMGDRPGELARPKGVAVDREGILYVVDAASQVVQMFNAEGQVLMDFGDAKSGEGALDLPAGIAIDYDNVGLFQKYAAPGFAVEYVVLVNSQMGGRKVSVYGFGKKK
jgi:sugar lactone lactonase YvrE